MTMSRSAAWTLATAVIALLVLVGAWFLLLGPQRAEAADLATQRNSVAEQNDRLALNQAQLQAQLEQLPAQKAQLADILASLPADSDLPQLLRQLESSAGNSGASLTSVVPGTAVAYDAARAPGVVSVPVAVTVAGDLAEVELYLKQLQADSTRYFLVDSVTLTAGTGGVSGSSAELSAVIAGKVFVLTPAGSTASTATATITAPPAAAATGASPAGATSTTLS